MQVNGGTRATYNTGVGRIMYVLTKSPMGSKHHMGEKISVRANKVARG